MTTRIAINGFGRIGRTILRQLLTTRAQEDIEIVLVNDIASLETCAYLFTYDSVFGVYPEPVVQAEKALRIGDTQVPFTHTADLAILDLVGVDIVLECTGHAKTKQFAEAGLAAGASQVLISGPSDVAEVTVVMGANDAALGQARIVSNASCTTNALAPILKIIDDTLGLETAHMTTIHCYTSSQPMIDTPRGALARSRAGALSMVPTTTSATEQVKVVLPMLADKITGAAVRVPTASVSAIDLNVTTRAEVDADLINALVKEADANLIGWTVQPLVSTDLRKRPESLVVALPETICQSARQFRLFGWYDNEWGFSARMIDQALVMAGRG